jgi:hypothetical protein
MSQLVASDMWKKATAPEPIRQGLADFPLSFDLEKDVTEAVGFFTVEFINDQPEKPMVGAVLQLTKAVDPLTLFKNNKAEKIQVPGSAIAGYRAANDCFFALPTPQTLVLADNPDRLAAILAAPKETRKDAFFAKNLDQAGEVVLAARMPDTVVDAMNRMVQTQKQQMRQFGGGSPMMMPQMGIMGFGIRLLSELKTAVVVMDLSRKDDPVRATVTTATENGAAFIGSTLALLEPSLTEAVADMEAMMAKDFEGPAKGGDAPKPAPAAKGAAPAPAAALEPLYKATFQGKEARITVSRAAIDRCVNMVMGTFQMMAPRAMPVPDRPMPPQPMLKSGPASPPPAASKLEN